MHAHRPSSPSSRRASRRSRLRPHGRRPRSAGTARLARTALALCAGLAPAASAQSPPVVLSEGQYVLGAGAIRSIPKAGVGDRGFFFAEIATTDPDPDHDTALVLNGFLSVPEGTPIANLAGASVDRFVSLDANDTGWVGCVLGLRGVPRAKDVGLSVNTVLVAQVGETPHARSALGVPYGIGSRYAEFDHARLNDRRELLALGRIDDTAVGRAGQSEAVLWRYALDGAGGIASEEALVMQGRPLPATGELVLSVGRANHPSSIALGRRGDWMTVATVAAAADRDSMILHDGAVLAREGELSVDGVRPWDDFGTTLVDLNALGDTLFVGRMAGGGPDATVLVRDGQAFVQQGQSFASIAPYVLTSFGTAPVFVADSGDVYWYGVTSDPDAGRDECLFRNLDVVVREGDPTAGGFVSSLASFAYAFDVSDSGRFLLCRAVESGREVLLLADFGCVLVNPGCAGNPAALTKTAGDARVDHSFTLAFDSALPDAAPPVLVWSTAGTPFGACGTPTPVGERLIDLAPGNVFARSVGGVSAGGPSVAAPGREFVISIPDDPALVGWIVYGQALHAASLPGGALTLELSNAVVVEVGA